MKQRYMQQPTLDEMLADPIIWTLMKSDSVDERELRDLREPLQRIWLRQARIQ